MSTCVNPQCGNDGRLDLISTEPPDGTVNGGGYHGGSWCSVTCLLATPWSLLASAYPGQATRPEPELIR